jgi:lysophospholipase L1-like esterase
MSFVPLSRQRLAGCALAAALALSAIVAPAAGAMLPPPPGKYYLAMGDSLAFGFQQAKFDANLPNPSPSVFDTGYVDDFGSGLALFQRHLTVINDGCPGATTTTVLKSNGCPTYPFALHHPYSTTQLGDALATIAAHPGQVNPITVGIGSNDVRDALLGLLGTCGPTNTTCIEAGLAPVIVQMANSVGQILGALRAAAGPRSEILLLGIYNPYDSALPGGDAITTAINGALASVAANPAINARFANPQPIFNNSINEDGTLCALTLMCPSGTYPSNPFTNLGSDIHASDAGYAVLAGLLGAAYLSH